MIITTKYSKQPTYKESFKFTVLGFKILGLNPLFNSLANVVQAGRSVCWRECSYSKPPNRVGTERGTATFFEALPQWPIQTSHWVSHIQGSWHLPKTPPGDQAFAYGPFGGTHTQTRKHSEEGMANVGNKIGLSTIRWL